MLKQPAKLSVTFRTYPFAELSLVITLFQFSLAIALLGLAVALLGLLGEIPTVIICISLWFIFLGVAIYLSGPRKRSLYLQPMGISQNAKFRAIGVTPRTISTDG